MPTPITGLHAIAAMSLNRVIGDGAKLPWHLPEDFKWFKSKTIGHVLVMGRKTYESIGKSLPNRTTIVLTRSAILPGIQTVDSVKEVLQLPARYPNKAIFVCGGGDIYRQLLPYCSDLFLTLVKRTATGDVSFPTF